ncbi:MAG: hypothetical protein FJ333_09925 [Sphingomonadales bacterium]|nr:hypothetical protein [Sphingomonadales bacterium]
MTAVNCHQYFSDGKAKRIAIPLREGRWQIEQCLSDLQKFRAEVSVIRDFVSGKASAARLSACVPSDKHIWLKKLPLHVAFCLGYDLLPALKALKNEGALCVDSEYPGLERDCLELLEHLEYTRIVLKNNIKLEYQHMKRGESLLEPLIKEALVLVQKALAVK